MTTSGLLIAGRIFPVPGLTVIPPASHGGPAWARLDRGDFTSRSTWVRQVIVHSTGGLWPAGGQVILAGAGPGGEGPRYADIWQSDPAHSAAHLVVDSAGVVVCLADIALVTAYHAEASNSWSVGIEMVQGKDGSLRQVQIEATARLAAAGCDAIGIPFQVHIGTYRGEPIGRMETIAAGRRRQLGGPDCVGVFGHRDQTSARGRGDPGDAIYAALVAAGAEPIDYGAGQDLELGRARQRTLVAMGEQLTVDGMVGPASLAAARRRGFARWRDVMGERPSTSAISSR